MKKSIWVGFSLMQGLLPIKKSQVPGEIIAGITLAALAIPEVMGYTKIAGTPVVTGLYTMLIPMALYAFFGASKHLVVGADSATAAILAAGLIGISSTGTDEYVALASLLALMAAAFLILARTIGLGFMADFLSRTVLIGFLTGVGIQVALGQLNGMLGLTGVDGGFWKNTISTFQRLDQTNLYDLGIAMAVLAVIILSKRISGKIPGPLIAVVGSIIVSWTLDLGQYVDVVGSIQGGLPGIAIPDVDWSVSLIGKLIPTAFAMFIVILTQSAATSRAYASKYNEKFSEDTDLTGLALANIGAGLSGTFVVNGSPTKTQMVDSAGGRTQLSQLTTVVIVLIVLLFLTQALSFLPDAVLAAVVFIIGLELIDIKGMRKIYAERRSEFWIAVITGIMVITIGVEEGIIFAIFLSLIEHTRYGYHPNNSLLTISKKRTFKTAPLSSNEQIVPGLIVYRFAHSMYYANSTLFSEEATTLVSKATPPLKWFCMECSAINDIDFTATETLYSTCQILHDKGVRVVFCNLSRQLKKTHKHELKKIFESDIFYDSVEEMLDDYQKEFSKKQA